MADLTTRFLRNGLAGDESDFSAFVARVSPYLVAVARRCGRSLVNRGIEPEDVVQDVWASCLPRLPDVMPQGGRTAPVVVKYLSVAVRRRVRDLMLAARNRPLDQGTDDHGEVAAKTMGIVTRIVAAERHGQVLAAIDALDPIDRDALVLLSIEQATLAEAAQILGITTDAAKQRHLRARRRLREQLPDSLFDELD